MLLSFDRPAIAGLSLLAAAIVTLPGVPAAGQPPWREEVTVTAAVEPPGFDVQSRVVQVVTREQIARPPVRSAPADRRRTANIRAVTTPGFELGLRRRFGACGQADVQYP
jgi:hypothetical protein